MKHLKFADIFLEESKTSISYMEKRTLCQMGKEEWLPGHSLRPKKEMK